MKNINKILPALIILFLNTSNAHSALISGNGYIDTMQDVDTIDSVYFNVNSDSLVNMSVFSTEFSDLDTYINLYRDDGSLTIDDFVAYSDDDIDPDRISFTGYDSYLSHNLLAGDYVLRISSFEFLEDSLGDYNYDVGYWEPAGEYGYEITGDVNFTTFVQGPELTAVPLPSSALLLASGLFALFNLSRSKQKT